MLRSKSLFLLLYFPIFISLAIHPATQIDFRSVSWTRHVVTFLVVSLVTYRAVHKGYVVLTSVPIIYLFGYIITLTSGTYCASVVGFLLAGSRVTKIGKHIKEQIEVDFQPNGQRTWSQVVSNCGVATLLCLTSMLTTGHGEQPVEFRYIVTSLNNKHTPSPQSLLSSYIHVAFLGAVACCCGDTFASELAPVFAEGPPVLLTSPWRRVPPGTNGGVTLIGFFFSTLGGTFQGCIHYFFTVLFCSSTNRPFYELLATQWPLVFIGLFSGFLGSLVDSLLGATLQFSGVLGLTRKITQEPGPAVERISGFAILDNDLVNFTSSIITAFVIPVVASLTIL